MDATGSATLFSKSGSVVTERLTPNHVPAVVRAVRYEDRLKQAWDGFVAASKNGTFLFLRDYMEYHSERFVDASLLFYENDDLVAILPASLHGSEVRSHAGLTFGGLISSRRMRTTMMLRVFDSMLDHFRHDGITKLLYKRVPFIYHDVAAEEDLYALFLAAARLVRRDVSAAVWQADRLPYTKGRKWCVSKSRRSGVQISRSDAIEAFMELEANHLTSKFGVNPVHSGSEMRLLATRFPENIKLFTAEVRSEIVAGVIIYESDNVAHAQYIAATDTGKELCALDAIIDHLITTEYRDKRWFDFGISTENSGLYLNRGLLDNKESYGARAVVHDFYELELASAPARVTPE